MTEKGYRDPATPTPDPVLEQHRAFLDKRFESYGPNTFRDHYIKAGVLVLVDILGELREMNRKTR